ncbi:MAG: PepSY domain-containing protein [Rhizobiales bacterium]|nr:PepSY domain-containing protein [Hyphomicrobiales bacterium]
MKTAAVASLLIVGFGAASLASEAPADSYGMKSVKLSVAEAVQIAEKAVGGKATAASLDTSTGGAAYEVDITLADGSIKSVLVDAMTGTLRTVSVDEEGNGDGGEQQSDVD